MIIRRRFRSLGRLLQRFGRGRINNYTTVTNMASRSDVPPVWEDDSEEPLIWPGAGTVDGVSSEAAPEPETTPEPAVQRAPMPGGLDRRTPRDLALMLELHEERMQAEGYRSAPPPFMPSSMSVAGPPLSMGSEPMTAPPVQRQAEPAPAPRRPRPTPVPLDAPKRRGRVIQEITPTQPDELTPPPSAVEPEVPDWETELAEEPQQPDLFEALSSQGIVQRRAEPDFSDAEVFKAPFEQERPPLLTPRSEDRPVTPSRPRPNVPPVQRERADTPSPTAADQRPSTPSELPAPADVSPVQRSSTPPAPPEVSRSSQPPVDDPDISIPPEGSTEADMLDMLGLPADTPVRGLRPEASQPPATGSFSPASPSAPSTASPASSPVQRSTASDVSASPADAPYMQPTTPEEAISRALRPAPEVPSASAEQPPVMRRSTAPVDPTEFRGQMPQPPAPPAQPPASGVPSAPARPAATPAQPSEPRTSVSSSPAAPGSVQRAPASQDVPPPIQRETFSYTGDSVPQNAEYFDDYGIDEFADTQPMDAVDMPPRTPTSAPERPVMRQPAQPPTYDTPPARSSAAFTSSQTASQPPAETPYSSPESPSSGEIRPLSTADRPSSIARSTATPPAVPPPPARPASSSTTSGPAQGSIQRTLATSVPGGTTPRQPADVAGTPPADSAAPISPASPTESGGRAAPSPGYTLEDSPRISQAAPPTHLSRMIPSMKSMGQEDPFGTQMDGKVTPPEMGGKGDFGTPSSSIVDGFPAKAGESFPGKISETAPVSPPSSGPGGSSGGSGGTGRTLPADTQQQLETMGFDTSPFGGGTATVETPTTGTDAAEGGTEESSENEGGSGQAGGGADVDKMAREVYKVLRDRLRIEQERRTRH